MKSGIRIFCLLICLLLFASVLPASAEGISFELPEEYMQFTLPENTVVLTPDTPITASQWLYAGISDPASYYSKYKSLSAVAHFAYVGGMRNVYLSSKTSSAIKAVHNLTQAQDSVKKKLLEQYEALNDTNGVTASAELCSIGDIVFIKSNILSESETISTQELCYSTVMNGVSYTFSILSQGALSQDDIKFIDDIVYSLKFTSVLPAPSNEYSEKDKLKMALSLVGIAAALIFAAVYTKVKKKSLEKQRNSYVQTITQFREERKALENDPNFKETPPLFLNKTVHTDELLRGLSFFQAYRKNLLTVPGYAFCAVISLYLAIMLRKEFLFVLIFAAITVFCISRLFFSQGKYERTLKRMYGKFPNRSAIFTFREDSFKLSGLQSNNVFPYVQITDAYETKDTFYLYFGEEICYIISKEGFALGTAGDFSEFLKRKLQKHFHKR